MAYEANQEYAVVVTAANLMMSGGGTPGLEITFENEIHGTIKDVLWLTPKTTKRVEKTLTEVFGLSLERIRHEKFYEEADLFLCNAHCFITTYLDVWKEKERVKVQWINKTPKETAPVDKKAAAKKAAAMMRGESPAMPAQEVDDALPF